MGLIYSTIKINGSKPNYIINQIAISQSYATHHSFEVHCTIPGKDKFGMEELKEILGETIEIQFKDKQEGTSTRFIGFVDSVQPYNQYGNRQLILKGFSPSIILDSGSRFRAFSEKSIDQITKSLLNNYRFESKVSASGKVSYSVQCQESDYRYLKRMADAYGLAFYYDGEQMIFGELDSQSGAAIDVYAKDLSNLEANINLCPLAYEVRAYDYQNDNYRTSQTPQRYGSIEPLVKAAIDKSSIYTTISIESNQMAASTDMLNKIEEQLTSAQTNNLVTIQGRGSILQLRIGQRINLIQRKETTLPGLDEEAPYIITSMHQFFTDNNYTNSFTAIPADHPFPVNTPNTGRPICGPLTAIVKDRADPESLGRVRVVLNMDANEALSPWLRVLTTSSSNGGNLWLPELEEKVILFFEDFNPENAPFVMGSFYTGSNKADAWKTGEKGIRMENISMIFNDEDGTLKIKAKSIRLEAEDSIELTKSKKISFDADEVKAVANQKMSLDGGQHLKQAATKIDLN